MKNFSFKKTNLSHQIAGLLLGLSLSATALAAVTSPATDTVKGRAPVMAIPTMDYTDVDGNNLVTVGDIILMVDGAITDADNDIPTASTYRWLVDGAEAGTASSYTVKDSDKGKTITAFATPHTDATITDPADGDEVAAAGGTVDTDGDGAIEVAEDNAVVSVSITGYVAGTTPQVGSPLTATPTCVAACETVSYQWQIESVEGSGTYEDIPGATAATYTPTREDQKRMIQVTAE